MRDHLDRFGETVVAVVTFAAPDRLAAYRSHLQLPFPVLSDPDRELYRLVGAERGSWRAVFSPATLRTYARLARRGRRLRLPVGDDVRQLGADVVIGADGRLRAVVLPPTPDDRPSVDDLVALLG